jgi:thymidylate synthase (FAD)
MEDLKIITEPSVYIVGTNQIYGPELEQFYLDENVAETYLSDAKSDAEELMETAGRLCYMSFSKPRPGGNQAYLKRILESSHGSVLEHGFANIIITGVSRSLTHELVRHRVGFGYSQLSQRYVDESNTAFVVPPEYLSNSLQFEHWKESCQQALKTYKALVNTMMEEKLIKLQKTFNDLPQDERTQMRKEVRQSARSVLPNCTETKIFATGNFRAWRHFIEMRASFHADTEICRLANKIYVRLAELFPATFGDYQSETKGNVTELVTPYRKV